MKKLGIGLLCCVLVLSGCFLFAGCGSEIDKYDELKEILFELQANNLDDGIYVKGTSHHGSNTTTTNYTEFIELKDLIINENSITECRYSSNYYWFFFEIESIMDSNRNIIWTNN